MNGTACSNLHTPPAAAPLKPVVTRARSPGRWPGQDRTRRQDSGSKPSATQIDSVRKTRGFIVGGLLREHLARLALRAFMHGALRDLCDVCDVCDLCIKASSYLI